MNPTSNTLAGSHAVDPGHSQLHIDIDHLGLSRLTTCFVGFAGQLHWHDADASLSFDVRADAGTASSGIAPLDALMKGELMLHTASFPDIRVALDTTAASATPTKVSVQLTLRGRTQRVPATLLSARPGKNMRGDTVTGVRLEITTARSLFGMELAAAPSIGDEIRLLFNIEAKGEPVRQQDAP